jgi:beta-glucosidase
VHGHSNIVGATLFPHNIGLGATRNYDLIRRAGEVTAAEMAVTGIDWDFSPVVAVTRDDRWGRTYESYSEDPEIVRQAAKAVVEGLQGRPGTSGFMATGRVVATAKHFLGDGGTLGGKDQGDNLASETELRDIHGAGYFESFRNGAQSVMVSQSSWHGREMHGNRALLTDVLKGRLGFDGILVGDWNGHGQVPGCTNKSCAQALNAGLDMFMVPDDWKDLYGNIIAQVRSGEVPQARLDDAVRRILRVKMRAGLFTDGKPSQRPLGGRIDQIGSPEHRQVARQAVRESLVLLKNNGSILPIRPSRRVLVAGDGANHIGKQSGGWTLSWQGNDNKNEYFPGATSIWDGIRSAVQSGGGQATLSEDGRFTERPDVAIVVFGENPYAEWEGDRRHLVFEDEKSFNILRSLRNAGVPVVSLFLSGRPLWVNPFLNASDAFVAAWLPGTEGGGIADVLFTTPDGAVRNDFRGKLSFSWPRLATQYVLNREDAGYDPLFPLGYGMTYRDQADLRELPVDTAGLFRGTQYFAAGPVDPWKLQVDPGIRSLEEAGARLNLTWPGNTPAGVSLRADQAVDLSGAAKGNQALAIEVLVEKAPTQPVVLSMNCGPQCAGSIDVTSMLRSLPVNEWRIIRVPLRCFAEAGANMTRVDAPFRLSTTGAMTVRLADIELVPASGSAICPPRAMSN